MFKVNKTAVAVKLTLLAGAAAGSFGVSTAFAADDTAKEKKVERIVITSRKKEETILEIPMSVSSVSQMEIEDRNYVDAQDLYRTLAGAAAPRGQLILRGLSGGNTASPDTTAVFTDDIPYNFTNLADIERVEVLRGPQGTLYGSNAIGGTVRIITNKPQMDDYELFGSMQVTGEKNVDGHDTILSVGMNIPLIEDTLAMRINGSFENNMRPYVNAFTGNQSRREDSFIRTQFRFTPTEDLDFNFSYVKDEVRSEGTTLGDTSKPGGYYSLQLTENADAPYGYDVSDTRHDCDENLNRPQCLLGGAPSVDAPDKYTVYNLIDGSFNSDMDLFSLTVAHDNLFDFASVEYAGSYREYSDGGVDDWSRLDGSDLFRTWIVNDDFFDRTTHEIRFQNYDVSSPLSWTVGMFYDKTDRPVNPNVQWQYHEGGDEASAKILYWFGVDATATGIAEFGNPNKNWNSARVEAWEREFSIFADVAYTIETDNAGSFELNAGIRRYDLEDYSHTTSQGIWSEDNVITQGEEDGFRKKLSVSWMPNEAYSTYFLYSEGYRPGGNNGPLAQSCLADPKAGDKKDRYTSDSIDNFELGFKGAVLDGRFNFTTAIYQINWSDIKTDIYMDTCGFSYTANGGEARSRGLEFESTAALTDDLTMVFNASYTKSELTEDNDAISGKKGDEMTMVPKYNAYLAFDQAFEVDGKPAYLRADLTAYGKYQTHFATKDGDEVPSYQTVNLSARYEMSESTRLSVHINNLFDTEDISYQRDRSRSASRSAQKYIDFLPERNITFRIDYTFM